MSNDQKFREAREALAAIAREPRDLPPAPVSEPCARSGFCCKVATCAAGRAHGAPAKGCTFLTGARPGGYACALVARRPDLAPAMAIGAGCGSPMFNRDRARALRSAGPKSKP